MKVDGVEGYCWVLWVLRVSVGFTLCLTHPIFLIQFDAFNMMSSTIPRVRVRVRVRLRVRVRVRP